MGNDLGDDPQYNLDEPSSTCMAFQEERKRKQLGSDLWSSTEKLHYRMRWKVVFTWNQM